MKSKVLYYNAFIIAATLLLCLHAMVGSTYLTADRLPVLLAGTAVSAVLLMASFRSKEGGYAIFGASTAAVMSIANLTALSLLYYTDGFSAEAVDSVAKDALNCFLLTCGGMVGGIVLLYLISMADEKRPTLPNAVLSTSALFFSAAVLVLSDRASGTTIVFGMQAAIPAAAVIVLCAAAAVHAEKSWMKYMCGLSAAALAGSLVIRNETGIPAEVAAAFIIWYMVFSKRRNKLLTVTAVTLPLVAVVGIGLVRAFGDSLSRIPLVDKIVTRLFSGNVEQVAAARRCLQQGGLFGATNYVYLPEMTSDYCTVLILHYLGIAALVLIACCAVPFMSSAASDFTRRRDSLTNTVRSMSLCLLTVMLVYNTMMCAGLLPVVGVQAPFIGNSKLFAILSGCLMGWICFPEEDIKDLTGKIKEIEL